MKSDGDAPTPSTQTTMRTVWYKALDSDELPDGRVKSVTCGVQTICMTRFGGRYAALDNKCPHQGGPLAEGSIENGYLRCPWHGWDFDPITGRPPGGYDDGVPTYPVEERDDGIYVAIAAEAPHVRTVTDVMAETMVNWGVRVVFGMVSHSNLGLADALRMQEEAGRLRYIGIRHEGAGAFAASSYGKLTGRPAACLTIAGPGATNLLTGLWDAHVDRAPLLALTGQVDTQVLGPGAFQEVDLQGAFGKVAQWSQPVLHTSKHAELMNLACKSAILNRGVSHLIFPDEVQTLPAGEGSVAGRPDGRITTREISPPAEAADAAITLLRKSERPVIIVGHGARFHMGGIIALAERLNAPIVTTFKGKGLVSDRHPLGCGVLGRSGTPIASWVMNESDCLLVLGASFSNHTGITPKKPTIQVDCDAMTLGKFHAVDVGNNTYSFGRYFECTHQSVLMSGYLGSIGFGFAAAMGAWAATQEDDERFRDRSVVSLSGDGGFGQYLAELTTAVKYRMNITHVLMNNDQLGKISKEQRAGNWHVWQTSLHNPDFSEYARICGAHGRRVTDAADLDDALAEALAHEGPSLVDIVADPELI